jgi:hypothetical protein
MILQVLEALSKAFVTLSSNLNTSQTLPPPTRPPLPTTLLLYLVLLLSVIHHIICTNSD